MAGYIIAPVIQKAVWAQCENPNCEKWRKLPPGTVINEDEPWYCYMNPDTMKSTCSASEVEYNEQTELVIEGNEVDAEEAARNRQIMENLEASIAAAVAAGATRGRGRGRYGYNTRGRGRSSGRGRGRPPLGGGRGRGLSNRDYVGGPGGRRRSVSFADDFDDEMFTEGDPTGMRAGSRMTRKQAIKQFQRILENQGQWDPPAARGRNKEPIIPPPLPSEAWEALEQSADVDTLEIAVAAVDVATSVKYFPGKQGTEAAAAEEEVGVVARLARMVAAASGLAENQEGLTAEELSTWGLDHKAKVLDSSKPLSEAGGQADGVADMAVDGANVALFDQNAMGGRLV